MTGWMGDFIDNDFIPNDPDAELVKALDGALDAFCNAEYDKRIEVGRRVVMAAIMLNKAVRDRDRFKHWPG